MAGQGSDASSPWEGTEYDPEGGEQADGYLLHHFDALDGSAVKDALLRRGCDVKVK